MDRSPARTLLGVWAHPDDEAYLSAGLMLRLARAGGRVVCLTATRGELGMGAGDDSPEAFGARRAEELATALGQLGVHDLRFLGFPDGGCEGIPDSQGTDAIAAVMDEIRPDVVVTFGPDGITGHPDHVAVSRWTTQAWADRQRHSALLYATMTPAFVRRHASMHRRVGVFPPGYPQTSLPGEVVFDVHLDDEELARKRAALAAHASQTDALAEQIGEPAFTRWWATESFRRPRASELATSVAA